MEAKAVSHDYFSELPEEIRLHIFSFLNQRELTIGKLVSKEWERLIADNSLRHNPRPLNYFEDPDLLTPMANVKGKEQKEEKIISVLPSGRFVLSSDST